MPQSPTNQNARPPKRQKLAVVFSSYYLDDFDFETAKKAFIRSESNSNIKSKVENVTSKIDKTDILKQLKNVYSTQLSGQNPWPFILPYMYGYINDNSTVFKGVGYYNYVIGYHNNASGVPTQQKQKLVFRLGHYDEQAVQAGLQAAKKQKSKSSPQTVVGIKHMQLGSIDLDIVFAGVLSVEEVGGNMQALISPMSGTWFDLMQKYIANNLAQKKDELINALNIMNIICAWHAINELSKPNTEQPEVSAISCCETSFRCKYTKLSCKEPASKFCQAVPKVLPKLKPNTRCLKERLDPNNEQSIECFYDIPEILKAAKKLTQ